MRFRLHIEVIPTLYGNKLPINYQYELSAWIYKVIALGDESYARWLHENGFSHKHKKMKMFTFSNLYIPDAKREEDRLCIFSDLISLNLSFLPEKSTEEFIKGIFSEQQFSLGDHKSKVAFRVRQVELVPSPDALATMEFKTLSPVVICLKEAEGNIKYLSPEHPNYGQLLMNNLTEKYQLFYETPFTGNKTFYFELLTPARSRLVTIKANTQQQTKVRGFHYSFLLKADPALIKVAYEAGLGEKGSLGFGMIESKVR